MRTIRTILMLLAAVVLTGCAKKSYMHQLVEAENSRCPREFESGTTLQRVEMRDGTAVFFIDDEDVVEEDNKDLAREAILKYFAHNDEFKSIVTAVIDEYASLGVSYKDEEGHIYKFTYDFFELQNERDEDLGYAEDDEAVEEVADDDDDDDRSGGSSMLELQAEIFRSTLPQKIDTGMTMVDVQVSATAFTYIIEVDEDLYQISDIRNARQEVKQSMRASLADANNADTRQLVNMLVSNGLALVYRYKGDTSGHYTEITFSLSELQRMFK